MNSIQDLFNVFQTGDSVFSMVMEFKSGQRSLLGLDGFALLLLVLSLLAAVLLLSLGLYCTKFEYPVILVAILALVLLFGDQMCSPLSAKVIGLSSYRTGWNPVYASLVFGFFLVLLIGLAMSWPTLPDRLDKEPCNGKFAVFSNPALPRTNRSK